MRDGRYAKLLEPGQIGKVRTRNRIYKSAAGMMCFHNSGCPTFMQMEHDGPWQSPLFDNAPATFAGPPIAASAVNIPRPGDFHRDMPRVLTVPEIKEITRKYVDAAERAQKAGFDGVDINAGRSHI